MRTHFLGIDVGSVTTKIVVVDADDPRRIEASSYQRTNGQPVEVVRDGLERLRSEGFRDETIRGVGVCGSARQMISILVGADAVKNEITAHAVAAITQVPEVRTIIEIGGQDSKLILVRDQVVVDFAMNTLCAAGTGSFLDQQAFRLRIPIEQFGDYALRATTSVRIAGRCTVFAESDMIHKQQLGFEREAIVAGLCTAMVRNYLNNVGKGKEILAPAVFQGGVANNKGIRAAFEKELGLPLVIPQHFDVMGAWGSALLAREEVLRTSERTRFRGLGMGERSFKVQMGSCSDCANECELTEAVFDGRIVARWGDRCEKWHETAVV